jgi:hypothetical protein
MPYFLVSHTSLIEANNERAAAEATLLALQHARRITFSVTVDQDSITRVVLAPPARQIPEALEEAGAKADQERDETPARSAAAGSAQDRPAKTTVFPTRILGYGGLVFAAGLISGLVLASL